MQRKREIDVKVEAVERGNSESRRGENSRKVNIYKNVRTRDEFWYQKKGEPEQKRVQGGIQGEKLGGGMRVKGKEGKSENQDERKTVQEIRGLTANLKKEKNIYIPFFFRNHSH